MRSVPLRLYLKGCRSCTVDDKATPLSACPLLHRQQRAATRGSLHKARREQADSLVERPASRVLRQAVDGQLLTFVADCLGTRVAREGVACHPG